MGEPVPHTSTEGAFVIFAVWELDQRRQHVAVVEILNYRLGHTGW